MLQSIAVGLDVGVGSAFQALNKSEYGIGLNIFMLAVFVPIGYLLIVHLSGYGAAWFYGARYLVHAILGILVVICSSDLPKCPTRVQAACNKFNRQSCGTIPLRKKDHVSEE